MNLVFYVLSKQSIIYDNVLIMSYLEIIPPLNSTCNILGYRKNIFSGKSLKVRLVTSSNVQRCTVLSVLLLCFCGRSKAKTVPYV